MFTVRSGHVIRGRAVMVTGAAAGIGAATAQLLARQGATVVLVDSNQRVEEQAAALPNAYGYQLDVSDRTAFERVLAVVERELGTPDVLINNAAVMALCPVHGLESDVARRVIETNLFGPLHGIQLLAPRMIARGSGQFVNVSSAAARWGIPGENVYVASKWALDGLGEVVRRELAPAGIAVTTVYMGPVAGTELSLGMKEVGAVRFSQPPEIAEAIVAAIRRPRPEVWVPAHLGWAVRATQLMPRRMRERLQELAGVTRVAVEIDREARAAYEQRLLEAQPQRYRPYV